MKDGCTDEAFSSCFLPVATALYLMLKIGMLLIEQADFTVRANLFCLS